MWVQTRPEASRRALNASPDRVRCSRSGGRFWGTEGLPMNWHPAHVLPSVTLAALVLGCSHREPASNERRTAHEKRQTAPPHSITSDELARQNANPIDTRPIGSFH